MDDEPITTVPKPDALLALHDVTTELFGTLRRWFAVPGEVVLNLHEIDSAVHELGDPLMIAAMAMRKLQALHLLATPGVLTTTDVVVTIVQDLDRALVQAPNMHLKLRAAATDWDAEFADLDSGPAEDLMPDVPVSDNDDLGDVGDFGDLDVELEEELAQIGDIDAPAEAGIGPAPVDPAQTDPAVERFRELHGKLHDAVYAVIEVSEGEIRYLA